MWDIRGIMTAGKSQHGKRRHRKSKMSLVLAPSGPAIVTGDLTTFAVQPDSTLNSDMTCTGAAGLRSLGLGLGLRLRGSERLRSPITRAVVCVPAKNEAARLPAFFEALHTAVVRAVQHGIACEVVIALDGCTDASHDIVAALTLNFVCPVSPVHLAEFGTLHAGRARKAAINGALERISIPERGHTAVLTTDADTHVDPDWIRATAQGLAETDMVAGWVNWDNEEPLEDLTHQEFYFDALHRHRRTVDPVAFDAPDPHHKMYGASLAIRADAYIRVGGLPERCSSEDVALTRAVRLSGLRMRQDRAVRVTTSTRRSGRATGGFSDAINSDSRRRANGGLMMVDDPRYLIKCYRASAQLRQAFSEGVGTGAALDRSRKCVESVEAGVGTAIPDFEFEQAWATSPSADAFVTRLLDPVPAAMRDVPQVPLAQAWTLLDELREEGGQ